MNYLVIQYLQDGLEGTTVHIERVTGLIMFNAQVLNNPCSIALIKFLVNMIVPIISALSCTAEAEDLWLMNPHYYTPNTVS